MYYFYTKKFDLHLKFIFIILHNVYFMIKYKCIVSLCGCIVAPQIQILCCIDIYFPTPLVHSVLISRLLFEDSDSGLFSVTLFRKAVDDFKHKARENK